MLIWELSLFHVINILHKILNCCEPRIPQLKTAVRVPAAWYCFKCNNQLNLQQNAHTGKRSIDIKFCYHHCYHQPCSQVVLHPPLPSHVVGKFLFATLSLGLFLFWSVKQKQCLQCVPDRVIVWIIWDIRKASSTGQAHSQYSMTVANGSINYQP